MSTETIETVVETKSVEKYERVHHEFFDPAHKDRVIHHLKVKIKSLAAEARIIREEERKALTKFLQKRKPEDTNQSCCSEFENLRAHRRGTVGGAMREALLAYGFFHGLSYARLEAKVETFTGGKKYAPDFDEVKKVVDRFAPITDRRWAYATENKTRWEQLEKAWALWREAAEKHLESY